MKIYIAFALAFLHLPSFAWDGSVAGKVSRIEVTSGNNYGFRVYLNGSPKLCGNDHYWAYINESDSNYQTLVSVLLAAKAGQFNVRIYSNRKEGLDDGYCHIGYIAIE